MHLSALIFPRYIIHLSKGDEKIKEIASITSVRIKIPPPSVNKDELTVAEDKEAVQQAVKIIMDIYKRREKLCKTISIEVFMPMIAIDFQIYNK